MPGRVRVKICGITRESDAWAAIEAGADALGFIVYPKSPRCVDLNALAPWLLTLPPLIQRTIVVVNEPLDRLREIAALPFVDAIQLHGDESAALCAGVSRVRRIKALRLEESVSANDFDAFPADAFLLDTPGSAYGGTGRPCDWTLAAGFRAQCQKPVFLAGGLGPDNVTAAIEAVSPYAIDANSGVEESPGRKDPHKIRALLAAVADRQ